MGERGAAPTKTRTTVASAGGTRGAVEGAANRRARPTLCGRGIPWSCRRLVIGSGAAGALPVLDAVPEEARRRGVELVVVPTVEAIELLRSESEGAYAIPYVTC